MDTRERKKIQRDRIKRYFIESTKELIASEGIDSVTTKKIGDKAGYSYATIYNYFKNFNELICICIDEFSNEMKDYLEDKIKDMPNTKEKIKKIALESVIFLRGNINLYKLYLLDTVNYQRFEEKKGERFIHPVYLMLVEIIENIPEYRNYDEQDKFSLADLLLAIFHTKVQFYIMLKHPKTFDELNNEIMKNVEFLLNKI